MAEDIKRIEKETPKTSDIKADFPYDAYEFDDVNKVAKPKILMKGFSWKLDINEIEATDGAEDGLLYLNGPLIAMSGASAFPTSDPGITGKIWSSNGDLVLSGYTPPTPPDPTPTITRLSTASIASVDVTLALAYYEDGGDGELVDGSILIVPWSGGTKVKYHAFTSGGTISGLSVNNWKGWGDGELHLMKSGVNWFVVGGVNGGNVWDTVITTNGGRTDRMINRQMMMHHKVTTPSNNSATYTFDFTFASAATIYVTGCVEGLGDYYFTNAAPGTTSVVVGQRYAGGYKASSGTVIVRIIGMEASVA